MYAFDFSEDYDERTNKLIWKLVLFFMLPFFVFFLAVSNFDYKKTIIACGITFLLSSVVVFVKSRRYRKIHCQDKILIDDKEVTKQDSQGQRQIVWDNVVKIKATMNLKGDVELIKLYEKDNKSTRVCGFNNMDKILGLISEKVSDNTIIQTKRRKLNWDNPFVLLIICWGISVPICLVLIVLGKYFLGPFSAAANENVIHPLIKFIFRLLGFDV